MPLFQKPLIINSSFSGPIKISFIFGRPRMEIGGLLQSGSIIRQIWTKAAAVFKKIKKRPSSLRVLILGLGAGTAAEVFSQAWPAAVFTGVEIDPEIIAIGRKYFKLKKLEDAGRLSIVEADAFSEIKNLIKKQQKFDLIVVDMYKGNAMVAKAWGDSFLKDLKKITAKNGILVFNHIFWGGHKKQAEAFVKTAENVFNKVKLSRVLANLLVFCSH